jgi:molecular chaperone GrpE
MKRFKNYVSLSFDFLLANFLTFKSRKKLIKQLFMNTENQTNESVEEIISEQEKAEEATGSNVEETINEEKNTKILAELAEAKDKYLRLYSEFDNFRKRTAKEKIDLISSANEQLMVALLSVVDDVYRAKDAFQQTTDIESVKSGVELVFNKLIKTLENKGLKSVESKGEVFNSDLHEALTQIPAPSDDLKGKVVDEIEKGYYLGDKLIRVAKVVIGS